MFRFLAALIVAVSCAAGASAQASGPAPGEYVCKEMKGTLLPCTPRHLFILEGRRWTWGPKQKGSYEVHGRRLKFEGEPHGPVTWGASHYEGSEIMFVDKQVTAVFALKKAAR